MVMYGAVTDELREVAGVFDDATETLDAARDRIDAAVADIEWYGNDADAFARLWSDEWAMRLTALADVSAAKAIGLDAQAATQDEASEARAPGSGSDALKTQNPAATGPQARAASSASPPSPGDGRPLSEEDAQRIQNEHVPLADSPKDLAFLGQWFGALNVNRDEFWAVVNHGSAAGYTDPPLGMSPEEAGQAAIGEFASGTNEIRNQATTIAEAAFPDDTQVTDRDAYRHALAAAMLTSEFGGDFATDITTAHERNPNADALGDNNQPIAGSGDAAEAMDLYNNAVGIAIAEANPGATQAELEAAIMAAYENGEFLTMDQDGNLHPTGSS